MSILSKIDRKSFFLSSVCIAVGFGMGFLVEQWLLWYRQVGRFNEILRRLSIIEDELLQLKVKLRRTTGSPAQVAGVPAKAQRSTARPPADSSEEDEFLDFDSDADEYLSVTSSRSISSAARMDSFFSEVDNLLGGSYEEKRLALQKLRDKRIEYSEEADFLWRWAKASHCAYDKLGGATNDTAKQHLYEALSFMEKALLLDNLNASVHKWYAVIIGSVGECETINQKIKNGYQFQYHISRAIELDEHDPESHYLFGRFCYAVYMLTWVERQMASALYATPPTATIDEALQSFLHCERLAQNSLIRNQLYTAQCYLQLNEVPKAVWWLESAKKIKTRDEADLAFLPEVELLLKKHRATLADS